MVKDYAVTEFRMVFEPSNNPKGKLAIIICSLISSTDKKWSLKIEQSTDEERKKLSLYEKAEAIRDVFIQEYHEIKQVSFDFNGKNLLLYPKGTVEDILVQIAEKI